jgi:hypothetical protein
VCQRKPPGSLEENGVVVRRSDGHYLLTPWGEDLRDVVYTLGRWASPLMARALGDDEFRPHWLRHIVVALFGRGGKRQGAVTVELRCGDDPMTLVSSGGRVHLAAGRLDAPDVVLTGRPDAVVGLLAGALRPADASAHGLSVTGDARRLSRLRP